MCLTSNTHISKEILSKQINFINSEDTDSHYGVDFLKRIMKRADLLSSIEAIEERFLPDGDKQLLIIVLESLTKGRKIQITKVKAI